MADLPPDIASIPPDLLMAMTLFSETKNLDDAFSIANVIKNRTNNPERYGATLQNVIFAPHQFSGVNSKEWNKVKSGKLTPQEQQIYDQFKTVARNVIIGATSDVTGGATNYFNPKLVKPPWSKKMQKTYSTDYHDYYKE